MNIVLRKEEKYGMLTQEALHFTSKVEQIMDGDSFSKEGSYMVRSLYFDTIDDKDFFDKINEQQLRRKIRLRVYSPQAKTAKLELKQKQGAYQKKRSLSISKEDAQQLIQGNNSVLLNYHNDFANEVYTIMSMESYLPKTVIEYQRRAFMAKENQIRLTFDSKICATEINFNIFDENLLLNPVLDPNHVVFEVKYDHFMLTYIADLIDSVDRRLVSSSKYCLGRSIGYPLYL